MDDQQRLEIICNHLRTKLPQEWLIGICTHTTCEGSHQFVRVDGDVKNGKRKLHCYISAYVLKITGIASDPLSTDVCRVRDAISEVCTLYPLITNCIEWVRCPLNCETCPQAKPYYNPEKEIPPASDVPFEPYEEHPVSP